jgi:site-specific DNA-methyltransferase (adenine-specific)
MLTEAGKAGFYETPYGKYPKLQILSFAELFAGKKPNIPLVDTSAFKKTEKEDTSTQHSLFQARLRGFRRGESSADNREFQ